ATATPGRRHRAVRKRFENGRRVVGVAHIRVVAEEDLLIVHVLDVHRREQREDVLGEADLVGHEPFLSLWAWAPVRLTVFLRGSRRRRPSSRGPGKARRLPRTMCVP